MILAFFAGAVFSALLIALGAVLYAQRENTAQHPPRLKAHAISGIYDRSDKVLAAEERKKKGIPDPSPRLGNSRVTFDMQAPTKR